MYTTGRILQTEADFDNAIFFQLPVRIECQVEPDVWEEVESDPGTIILHSRFAVHLSAGYHYVKPNHRFILK